MTCSAVYCLVAWVEPDGFRLYVIDVVCRQPVVTHARQGEREIDLILSNLYSWSERLEAASLTGAEAVRR